jgi:hypothetical protein
MSAVAAIAPVLSLFITGPPTLDTMTHAALKDEAVLQLVQTSRACSAGLTCTVSCSCACPRRRVLPVPAAHDASQLRAATHTPNSAAAAVAAAAAGTPVMRRTQSVVPAGLMTPMRAAAAGSSTGAAAAAAAAAAGGAAWSVQGSPSVMPVPWGLVQGSPQQLASAGTVNTPWMHTDMGWVPAGPGMGQSMMATMPGMQPGMQQGLVQTSLMMQGAPALIPAGPGMLDGLAAGFSGISLQDPAQLSSSQGYACMPAMLHGSGDNASGMVHGSGASAGAYDLSAQGVGGLPVGQPSVIMYAQPQGPGVGPGTQQ